uniref:Uncharacterized protein LOC113796489 n=1 Tax=Dermatophagoides pteronyssinus TaxID=6956 RepID=A0A6P6YAV6_DERPT|nr:uncharacterized protein LOC113796489 [Dermatophagoides pteronyssinus]
MEIDRQIRMNENDLQSAFQSGPSIKPSAMSNLIPVEQRKKGISLISANTPASNRRKLGNLSNTPFQSLKKLQNDKKSNGIHQQQQQCSSMKISKQLKSTTATPMLSSIDEIENAYPLNHHEYREQNFPSEFSDYYIEHYHPKLMLAPFEDEIESKRLSKLKQMQDELSVEDYFADFI